jgi:hypothetical protein
LTTTCNLRYNGEADRRLCTDDVMYQPAHIDGKMVVFLRREWRGFRIIESGRLSHDGKTLTLIGRDIERPFTEAEMDLLMIVSPENRIPECDGYDLFSIVPE